MRSTFEMPMYVELKSLFRLIASYIKLSEQPSWFQVIMFANDDVLAGKGSTTLSLLSASKIGNETVQNQPRVIRIIWFCLQVLMLSPYTATTCSGGLFNSNHPCHQGFKAHGFLGRKNLYCSQARRILIKPGKVRCHAGL